MPLWLEKRYANMISPKLGLFKWKKPTLANFRCPYCMDSKKNKRKARGYLYTKGNALFYKCHNCPASTNFSNFLKFVDPNLHLEFLRENFAERRNIFSEVVEGFDSLKKSREQVLQTTEVIKENNEVAIAVNDFRYIDNLPEDHFARLYIEARKIPKNRYDSLFYTDNMREWVRSHINSEYEGPPVPCIGIIVKDKDGKIIGVNGRSLKPENKFSKYIKAKVNEDIPLIFGLDRLNLLEKVYVFEGEFDSMFLPNAIAVGGVGMMSGIEKLINVNKEQIIQVVDNDPRNKEVVSVIGNLIESGYAITILPGNIEGKDVNDLVRENKYDSIQIKKLIDDNTFSGLTAKLKFAEWKKC